MSRSKYQSDISAIVNERDREPESNSLTCEICNAASDSKFIILNCSHVFHVNCIVTSQLQNYKYTDLDSFTNKALCIKCSKGIDKEDILIMHTKFISSTENTVHSIDEKTQALQESLAHIKSELRSALAEKSTLQQSREKSKYLVSILEL